MNFNNLTTEGYTAFILAIIFSITTIALIINFFRNSQTNKFITILTTLVSPILTVFCWFYLIMNVCAYSLEYCLYIALAAAVAYAILSVSIGFVINAILNKEPKTKQKKEKKVKVKKAKVKKVKETQTAVVPLLIENQEAAKQIENQLSEEKDAENTESVESAEDASSSEKTVEEIVENEEEIKDETIVLEETNAEEQNISEESTEETVNG